MRKRLLFFCVAALFCASKLHAHQGTFNYASASLIYASPSWGDVKDGYGLGAAIGVSAQGVAFAEIETMYLRHNMKNQSGSLTQVPVLATFAFRYPVEKFRVGLQVGGSAGAAMQQWKILDHSNTKIVAAFSWQALVAYYFCTRTPISINVGIKELWTGKSAGRKSGVNRLFSVGGSIVF
jgi:hypothetical protein